MLENNNQKKYKESVYNVVLDQFQIDDIFISIRDLKKQQYYKSKQKYFKKVLSRCFPFYSDLQYDIYTTPIFRNSSYYINPINSTEFQCIDSLDSESEKVRILNKLIKLTEKLCTYNEDTTLKEEFRLLEEELSFYLDGYDQLLLHEPIYLSLFYTPDVTNQIKNLHKKLASLLRKKITQYGRDLRQSFRSIIKFLFKNMDDESDANNVLRFSVSTTLYNHSIHYHGKKGNHSKIKCT